LLFKVAFLGPKSESLAEIASSEYARGAAYGAGFLTATVLFTAAYKKYPVNLIKNQILFIDLEGKRSRAIYRATSYGNFCYLYFY